MEEIWKDYIYNYQISNKGRIRNKITDNILKTNVVGDGYLGICVSLGNKSSIKCVKIHRAVAESFIPNPENKPQVNHIDGNKHNNNVSNLEWVTSSENIKHAWDNGLIKSTSRYNKSKRKLNNNDIEFIRNKYIPKHELYGVRALSRKFNVSHSTIVRVIQNKRYKMPE